MIYTEKTIKAMQISYKAHLGQEDKSGVPYIFHPIHVAEQMDEENACVVALLHDVVEDTSVDFEYLENYFDSNVIVALKLLTHDKNVDYLDYVKKIKSNPIATKVKLADLKHNSDITRLNREITDDDRKRIKKYERAIEILKN